ncbi:MAG: hypothetical protein KDC34_03070 [Saprospiraceae bacterium]|nr:hypothetical protein [Saprospiraceae bacterium]
MAAPERIGVIDLGTNTFHLLIVETQSGLPFREIYRERRFIKLAEGGIETISDAAFERALITVVAFRRILEEQQVKKLRALGTAALRTASNGPQFVEAVFRETGIKIELITGDREAVLIHKGVAQAVPLQSEADLIMDIGGGSVEFILANKTQVFWAESFPVGVAVLYHRFHGEDPISSGAIADLEHFLSRKLANVWIKAREINPQRLIGASGTFDVLENILVQEKAHPRHSIIDIDPFYPLAEKFIRATLAERLQIEGLPASRADMIVVAVILIRVVLQQLALQKIVISEYAMKEGLIAELSA